MTDNRFVRHVHDPAYIRFDILCNGAPFAGNRPPNTMQTREEAEQELARIQQRRPDLQLKIVEVKL